MTYMPPKNLNSLNNHVFKFRIDSYAFLQDNVHAIDLDKFIIGGDVLDEGELSAIALYKHLQADFLLIDEKAGRRIAKLNHIQIIGSLGVLIEAKKQGLIPELKPHIETLRQAKIYFSNDSSMINRLHRRLWIVFHDFKQCTRRAAWNAFALLPIAQCTDGDAECGAKSLLSHTRLLAYRFDI